MVCYDLCGHRPAPLWSTMTHVTMACKTMVFYELGTLWCARIYVTMVSYDLGPLWRALIYAIMGYYCL